MAGRGAGGGTPFESMSHEQMLAWLDQAKSGEVQAAADRLTAAAEEIRKIADELKVRPQWVEWKGEGADAFRTWAADLANSTLRLGDFSDDAAKWLGQASGAIATAQASIPRDTKGAQANLDAARAAHNDPDAAAVGAKSRSELAALAADKEKVRQEAAAQMRKLAQSYSLSATQMNQLERPKFPPPPAAITPGIDHGSQDLARPGTGTSGGMDGGVLSHGTLRDAGTTRAEQRDVVTSELHREPPVQEASSRHLRPPTIEPATQVAIDSVSSAPEVRQPAIEPTGGLTGTARPDLGTPLPTNGLVCPTPRGPARTPSALGGTRKSVGGGRLPGEAGQGPVGVGTGRGGTAPGRNLPGSTGATGRGAAHQNSASGRGVTPGSGVTGGRPATPSATGRSMGRVPGASAGSGPAASRGAAGRQPITGVTGQPVAGATGQPVPRTPGSSAGRATAAPHDGIIGGTPQRTGPAPARPGAPVPSAPTRGGVSGGVPSGTTARAAVRGAWNESARRGRQRNEKQTTDRPTEPPTTD